MTREAAQDAASELTAAQVAASSQVEAAVQAEAQAAVQVQAGEQADALGSVYAGIDALIDFAHQHLLLDKRNDDWARNGLFALFALDSYTPTGALAGERTIDAVLAQLLDALVAAQLIEADERAEYGDIIMGLVSANPAAVQDAFLRVERQGGGMAAMRWFYEYCVDNTYVKQSVLARNPRFDASGLVVTINLAKPEFKNMSKAAAGNSTAGGYPLCTICHANEGFAGRHKRTLRTVPVTLGGSPWFWQFSPYGYFHQHGICVNDEHTPMHVDRETFVHLLDFVDRFPGYFLGCNAALPRIGGSVLAHDHYQGGGELLPMHRAAAWAYLHDAMHPHALLEILDWPGTAVRIVSHSREDVVAIADAIRQGWVAYANEALGIVGHDEEGQHSAVSPTVIITNRGYEMSLIFRNNAVSEQYPDGIFHAHPEFYPVKQEPIGLIEAQGLFILPGRLVHELADIEDALVADAPLPEAERSFTLEWDEVRERLAAAAQRSEFTASTKREFVHRALQEELGSVCERILENTAVFKRKSQTLDFLRQLGFTPDDAA